MKTFNFLLLSILGLTFASCQKQETEQAQSGTAVAVRLKASNTATIFRMALDAGVTAKTEAVNLQWTAAKASASQLKFEAKKSGSEVEFKTKVQQTVDLFNVNASLGNISIQAATYDEVELKALLSPVGQEPALQMIGTLTSASGSTQVMFTANENIEVKGEKKNVTITGSTLQSADIPLNFSMIVKGMTSTEFDNAAQTNGVIVISASSNSALYNKMVSNLRSLKVESEFHH